jgi:hypothetical protein
MLEAKGCTEMAGERIYRAFLVRMWTVAQNGGVVWRASVQDAHTGHCRAFADLVGLCEFLAAVVDSPPDQQDDQSKLRIYSVNDDQSDIGPQ